MIVLKVIIADIEDVGRLQKILLVRDLLSPHAAHIDCKGYVILLCKSDDRTTEIAI